MILQEDIYFIDNANRKWLVPRGATINGATIPRALWHIIGSPYVGLYRRASVIHDYFVGENNPAVPYSARREADKMFYEACLKDGCSKREAAILYTGVSVGTWYSNIHGARQLKGLHYNHEIENIEIQYKFDRIRAELEPVIESGDFKLLEAEVERLLHAPLDPATSINLNLF